MAVKYIEHNVTITGNNASCSCGKWMVKNHPRARTVGYLHIIKARIDALTQLFHQTEEDNAHTV